MDDILIPLAVNTFISLARDPKRRSKWRRQLLKVFVETVKQFKDDVEFQREYNRVVFGGD